MTSAEPLSNKPAPPRLDWIDALRGLSALYVTIDHITLHCWKINNSFSWPLRTLHAIFAHGQYAVATFIVISGFCLMIPPAQNHGRLKGGLKEYARRRCRRILPPYYACLLISLLLIQFTGLGEDTSTFWSMALPESRTMLIVHAIVHGLLLQDFYGSYKINYPLWTIAAEFHIYFLFPLLLVLWRKAGVIAAITPPLAYVLIKHFAFPDVGRFAAWHYIALFAIGMAAATVAYAPGYEKAVAFIRRSPDAAWLPLLAVAGYIGSIRLEMPEIPDLFFSVIVALLLIRLAVAPTPLIRRPLTWKPIVFLGAFSYSLYLMHAPLIQLTYLYLVRPLSNNVERNAILLHLVATPVCLIGSYLFHLRFEKPYLHPRRDKSPAAIISPTCL